MAEKIGMISLGCPKNQVDAEWMLARLSEAGYTITNEVDGADLVVVNTCGFIEEAKQEAIENILDMAELKKEGVIGKIVVTGCLAERYREEIRREIPEADAVVGLGSNADIADVCRRVLDGETLERFGEKTDLPVPTDEELGFETNGSVAYYTNSDGSVIAGYVVDNYSTNPLLIWRLQDDGSYVCDPVCTRYFSPDGDMEGRPYVMFAAQGLSRNGRYVSLNVMDASSGLYEQRIGRLDLETGEVETYVADGSGDIQANAEMQATQVSNDGTIIGWSLAGSWAMQVRSAVIWYKGEDPKLLSNVVPDVEEIANFDSLGFNTVIDITPDGRYVVGFAMDEMYNYKGYVLDLGTASSAINEVVKDDAEAYEVARYAINGTRLQAPTKGINIVKMSDGTTKKVIVKE